MAEIQANWTRIHQEVNEATWGESGAIVAKYAQRFGTSTDKIYRELRKRFGQKRRRKSETQVDPDNKLIQMIFDMKLTGKMMHLKRREISTEICIQKLMAYGVEGADQLTVTTVNRRLNRMGFRERQPNKRIESLYANQVHMIDFSRSKYFQIYDRDDNGDFMLVVSGKELHYKDEDKRIRSWLVQYMDDYSRLRKVRAYAETSESGFLGLDHLNWCYLDNEDDAHLLKYLPIEQLRSDNGSFKRSSETKTAMDMMGIYLPPQEAGGKGGTAKVENRFRSLWQQFELPTAIQLGEGSRIRLSEYNELLEEFCYKEHFQKHPHLHGVTKGEAYERSLADRSITQRTTDVDLISIACKVEKRKVDDHLRISLNGMFYEVPQYVQDIPTIGQDVYVYQNKYGELTGKLIADNATETFEITAWEPSYWGEMERFPFTDVRKREEEFKRHQPTMRSITGQEELPAGAAEEVAATKTNYMPPVTEPEHAQESPFVQTSIKDSHGVFNTEFDARAWVGEQLEVYSLSYGEVAHYFDEVMTTQPIYKSDLQDILKDISQHGKQAVNY